MPRKKVVTTREELDGKDAETTEIQVPDAVADESDDILGALLGTDGRKYRVHKMPSKAGEREAFCQDYTKEEFDPAAIRAVFGGGTYRVTVFGEDNKITNSRRLTIADLPKSNLVIDQNPRPAQTDATQLMLMEFIKGQSQMVAALLSRETAPPVAGPTAMELVTLIKALQPADGGTDPVALLLKGLELGKGMGDGGTDWMDLAKTGLTAAVAMAGKPAAPAPTVTRAPPPQLTVKNGAAPADVPRGTPAEPTPAEREQMDIIKKLNWLKAVTGDLVRRAAKGKDAELYAEVFLDNLPDFISLEEVAERFADPGAVAMLAQLDPAVTAYAPWFAEFQAAVNSMIASDEDDPLPPVIDADGVSLQ